MKTTEFIVEYAGIGEDADAMGQDHEVQLARQSCYHAARDAIALHHILKDVSEQEGLEGWVSEKLTQAASNLNDVIEHLEGLRGGDGEEGMEEIMQAFSFESAEAQYDAMLEEGIGDVVKGVKRKIAGKESPEDVKRRRYLDTVKDNMAGKNDSKSMRRLSKVTKVVNKESATGQVNELDASTMQAYLTKRKDSPMPGTMHKAGVQAAGVRNAKEKIHAQGVTKAAKQTGRIQDMDEGRFVKGPGGVPLDRQGNPKVPKLAPPKAIRAPVAPKLNLDTIWRKVEDVVGQIYPDGDPIDWMIPWFRRQGIDGFKVGELIDAAARKNGYKDMYDYWQSFGEDTGYNADFGIGESRKTGKTRVKENASAGGTSAGAVATGPTGAANKPGTGKPKKVANMVKRTNPTVGKGIY